MVYRRDAPPGTAGGAAGTWAEGAVAAAGERLDGGRRGSGRRHGGSWRAPGRWRGRHLGHLLLETRMRCAAGRWRRAPRTTARGGLEPGGWRCGARGDWGWGGRRCLGRWAVVRPERERPGAAPVARSYGLHAEELDPGADPHGSGRHRPRIRTRRPESSSPPCAPPRAAAAVCGRARLRSPGPARRPLAPRRHASARARAAPLRPLRSAAPTWGGERAARRGHQRRPRNLCAGGGRGWRGPWGTALGSAAAGSGAGGRDREREGGEGGAREGKAREMGGTERADGLNHD